MLHSLAKNNELFRHLKSNIINKILIMQSIEILELFYKTKTKVYSYGICIMAQFMYFKHAVNRAPG